MKAFIDELLENFLVTIQERHQFPDKLIQHRGKEFDTYKQAVDYMINMFKEKGIKELKLPYMPNPCIVCCGGKYCGLVYTIE